MKGSGPSTDNAVKAYKLKWIMFLDSLCFGLMYPYIPPYLVDLQGKQISAGILVAFNLICSLISEDIAQYLILVKGRKFAIYLIFMMSIFSHFLLITIPSITVIVISRVFFTLINQANPYCKTLLSIITPEDTYEKEISEVKFFSSVAYVLGPLLGGYIFSVPGGFTIIGLLVSGITFANILILLRIRCPNEKHDIEDFPDLIDRYVNNIEDNVDNFKNSNLSTTWPFVATQFLFTVGWTVFFLKYVQILYFNFNARITMFGTTTAYQNFWMCVFTNITPRIKSEYLFDRNLFIVLDSSYMLFIVSLCVICYTQELFYYWLAYITLILAKSIITSHWRELYNFNGNKSLIKLIPTINILSGICTPLAFAYICDLLCPSTVKFLSVTFVLMSFVVYLYFVRPRCIQ